MADPIQLKKVGETEYINLKSKFESGGWDAIHSEIKKSFDSNKSKSRAKKAFIERYWEDTGMSAQDRVKSLSDSHWDVSGWGGDLRDELLRETAGSLDFDEMSQEDLDEWNSTLKGFDFQEHKSNVISELQHKFTERGTDIDITEAEDDPQTKELKDTLVGGIIDRISGEEDIVDPEAKKAMKDQQLSTIDEQFNKLNKTIANHYAKRGMSESGIADVAIERTATEQAKQSISAERGVDIWAEGQNLQDQRAAQQQGLQMYGQMSVNQQNAINTALQQQQSSDAWIQWGQTYALQEEQMAEARRWHDIQQQSMNQGGSSPWEGAVGALGMGLGYAAGGAVGGAGINLLKKLY